LLHDEVGNSHTGRQLNVVWKAFLTEIDQEMQHYQVYRAYQNTKREPLHSSQMGMLPNWKNAPERERGTGNNANPPWLSEMQRRSN
jgi:hypothetical protein